mmetsp:Transcript_3358/g.5612  ORF Transcript_3358/g.5612 Transcript_3358/m.5612 type:complete len:118 (-) Transcript_3358:865-1218(-)
MKLSSLDVQKPELRFYPNMDSGESKVQNSFGILFNKENKNLEAILEEISNNLEHTVKEISTSIFNNMIVTYAQEQQKNVVYFMYDDGQSVSISFKALSTHPLLQEDCVFMALFKPQT